jgi:hypothetical protein
MTFIGDLTAQIIELSEKSVATTLPMNLGSNLNISVRDFAFLVAQEFDAKVDFSSELDQADYYFPDISRLAKFSNIPILSLSEGIKITRSFY